MQCHRVSCYIYVYIGTDTDIDDKFNFVRNVFSIGI